jgi:hypothetical protein
MSLWTIYVVANSRASVVSRKWVSAADETEAREIAMRDSKNEEGRVLLAKKHHSGSVSMTDQWSVVDIKAIAEHLD